MQVQINKVRVIDKQSKFHNQLVNLVVSEGIIISIKPVSKAEEKKAFSIATDEAPASKIQTQELIDEVFISQGWVDVLADYREPGYEQKETIETGMSAAAAAGFTDVMLAPNTTPASCNKGAIQYILQKAAGNVVNLHPIGSASQNTEGKELAEMLDMHNNGAIAFSDGWKPLQNANLMLKVLEYVKAFNGTIIQLPIDEPLSRGGLMSEGVMSTSLGMPGIPLMAETLMVYRDLELLRYTGSKLHITGISTSASLELIKKAKADGLSVTCSVTPYHLALTEDILSGYDSNYKVFPPLRSNTEREALISAVIDGTIDCIASHHRPHEWDAKTKEFEYAADGMAVQELCYHILWSTLSKHINEERLTEMLAIAPRRIFGIAPATIAKGAKASLTLFTSAGKHTLHKSGKKSKGINNPFFGKELPGAVLGIINNGKLKWNK